MTEYCVEVRNLPSTKVISELEDISGRKHKIATGMTPKRVIFMRFPYNTYQKALAIYTKMAKMVKAKNIYCYSYDPDKNILVKNYRNVFTDPFA